MELIIQRIDKTEILEVSKINKMSFPRQIDSDEWIKCSFNAFPKIQIFTAKIDNKIVGYILWTQKGGFRKQSVLELEQIGILTEYQGKGIGKKLIQRSLDEIKKYLADKGSTIKNIIVTSRTDNKAQEFYKKVLNAKPEAIIKDLYTSDEVILIARQ